MDLSGYRQGVIHLAWFRDDRARFLLFGMVQLLPTEFPDGGRISAMLNQFEQWQSIEREARKSRHISKALSEMRAEIDKLR